jgi:hypothetical protein
MHGGYPLFFFVTSRIAPARPVLIALILATSSAAAPVFEADVDADAQSAGVFDNIGDFVSDSAASSIELGFKLNNLPSPSGIGGFRTLQLPTFFADAGVLGGVWAQGQTDFSGTITVGPFDNVPTGIPLELRMSMSLATFAFKFPTSEIGDSANAFGDLGSTLNFRSSGSVFAGPFESVNSVQGSIVDGMWMGTPVTVPEPSAPSLAALCALAAIYAKRREGPIPPRHRAGSPWRGVP